MPGRLHLPLRHPRGRGAARCPRRPSAIFASNDEMALGVMVAAMRAQVAVPQALSITGFDDAQLARMAWPQLTTVRQPNADLAAAAISLLADRGDGPDGARKSIELPMS
ncbi:substrate-binding domain-containing protein [Sphingomonas sp. I4]